MQAPVGAFPLDQLLSYGPSGLMMVALVLGGRFAGRVMTEALTAFRDAAKENNAAMRETVIALQSLERRMGDEFEDTRTHARQAAREEAAVPFEQVSQQLAAMERALLARMDEIRNDTKSWVREIRGDLRLTPARSDTPPGGFGTKDR